MVRKILEKIVTIAIYSGKIPSSYFIENLINLIADREIEIYLFGKGKYINYRHPNIKTMYTPKGNFNKIFFVCIQLLRLFIIHPKKFYKLINNHEIFSKSGSIINSLSKILPVLNHTPDIFHIQWAKSLPFWFFLKELFGVKIVLSLRGSHINYSADADEWLAHKYNTLFPKVDKMHAVSEKIISKAEEYGAEKDKIDVIYSTLDFKLLNKFEKNHYEPHTPFRFLSVGRFHWVKGYQYSLSAIEKLKKLNKEVEYTIISNNRVSEEILYQIDDLSLDDNVKIFYPSSQSDVYNAIRESDCFILPSVEEGISNVVLESLAIGLPVVSSDCGGMREVIENGINGYIFPARDIISLQNLLLKIIDLDIHERKKIINKGKNYIQDNFDSKLIKSRFHNLYKHTLDLEK